MTQTSVAAQLPSGLTLPPLRPVRLVVLDFDGTFTDSEAEGAPFLAAYPAILAELAGLPLETLVASASGGASLWQTCLAETAAESPEYGWIMAGRPAAPADADPYIRASMAAHKAMDKLAILLDPAQRAAVLGQAYKLAYVHSAIVFRAGAQAALDGLLEQGIHVFVVTNSDTGHVSHKVDQLGLRHRDRVEVFGNAMKFHTVLDAGSDAQLASVPDKWPLPGLQRPLYARRDKYLERLQALWQRTDTTPAETLVCGDILELDLLLPALLGARVHLIERANTYPYERAALAALGERAGQGHNLLDLLTRLA